jgi:hypothetical protein
VLAELGSCDEPGGAGAHDQSIEMLGFGHADATMAYCAPAKTPAPGLFVPQQ